MRFSSAFDTLGMLAAWASLVVARPLPTSGPVPSAAEGAGGRRLGGRASGEGGCKPNIFIFARGTGEPGLMGYAVGPPVTQALKKALGEQAVAAEGVKYSAGFAGNLSPGGDPAGVSMMKKQVTEAARGCPQSNILLGGYSQGAGLANNAIRGLSAPVKARITGVVLFGDPSLLMGRGRIPGLPANKVKEFCASGDPVCGHPTGGGGMGMGHLGYGSAAPQAARFLVGRIHAAGAHGGGGGSGGGSDGAAGGAVEPDNTKGGGDAGAGAQAGAGNGGGGDGDGGGGGGGGDGSGGAAAHPESAGDSGGTNASGAGGVGSGGDAGGGSGDDT